jgi:acyl dehydratase
MMETHFFLGQSMEWSKTFSDEELGGILLSQGGRRIVHESWTTYVVLSLILNWLSNPPGMIVQQEMVYFHPIYMGDQITARVQIISIDHSNGWITLSTMGMNQWRETILAGQVIVSCTQKR